MGYSTSALSQMPQEIVPRGNEYEESPVQISFVCTLQQKLTNM